jgi:hypothetical protein
MKLPVLFSNTVDRDGPVTGESGGWRQSANVKNLFFYRDFRLNGRNIMSLTQRFTEWAKFFGPMIAFNSLPQASN